MGCILYSHTATQTHYIRYAYSNTSDEHRAWPYCGERVDGGAVYPQVGGRGKHEVV